MIGQSLGQYQITSKLGEGGMGVVYRATDSRLGRDVAVKVLPPELARDPERSARFEREARSLAALNHPHIASIHGLEEHNGQTLLVMELAAGEDLSAILQRGPLRPDQAVPIARQIAEGLEEAHERGIVHRDLKPANIKVDAEGQVKILDFGLARAMAAEPESQEEFENSPTITAGMTQAGVILGTAAYMSPEQARGRVADKRSDVWSFGVVLWEMLTGAKLFEGETLSDTMAGVLKNDIDPSALPSSTPPAVLRLLERCLERDPKRRLRDIGEARILLSDPLDTIGGRPAAGPSGGSALGKVTAAALVGLVLGTGAMFLLRPGSEAPPPERAARLQYPIVDSSVATMSSLSPDGTAVAYESENQFWVREFVSHESYPVPGTESAGMAVWSPDGEWIAFATEREIHRSRPDGRDRTLVCPAPDRMSLEAGHLQWPEPDRIVFTTGSSGIWEVSAHGGEPREILAPGEGVVDLHDVQVLPEGRGYLFVVHGDQGFGSIDVYNGSERREVLNTQGANIRSVGYTAGHIVYSKNPPNEGVWAVPFSLETLETDGEPFLVAGGTRYADANPRGDLSYSRRAQVDRVLVRLDGAGRLQAEIGEPLPGARHLRVSPDGTEAALATSGTRDEVTLQLVDLATGDPRRLTFNGEVNIDPAFSPDGTRIAHAHVDATRNFKIVIRDRDGRNERAVPGSRGFEPSLLSDGRLLMTLWDEANLTSVAILDPDQPDTPPVYVARGAGSISDARVTHDEQFVAYMSSESGRDEVMVKTLPPGAGQWQASRDGARFPFWSTDGRMLYFRSLDEETLMGVTVTREPLRFGPPRELFSLQGIDYIDAHPDGGFVALRQTADADPDVIEVWLNWGATVGGP